MGNWNLRGLILEGVPATEKLCLVVADPKEIVGRILRDRSGWWEWVGEIDPTDRFCNAV